MVSELSTRLKVDAAYCSTVGRKAVNEDCADVYIPTEDYQLENKGISLVVADGVSTAEAGREASHTAVERFVDEYYQTPDTWSVAHCGEKILSTINLRLYRKSHEYVSESKGYLSTFSALVIKSRAAHFFHVGDSRIYRLFKNEEFKNEEFKDKPNDDEKKHNSTSLSDQPWQLEQLTTDHTAVQAYDKTFLARAIGMDNSLHLDYGRLALEPGDRLLLSSDGVHDFIEREMLMSILSSPQTAEEISRQLVDKALENNSDDNLSAVVAIVEELPNETLDDYSVKLTRLPFPPDLEVGMKIDGYEVKRELFASNRSQLYLVRDTHTGECYAMKTPSRNFEDDVRYIDRFIQEEWVGSRIQSDNVVKIVTQTRRRNYLYYLMEYIDGKGLDVWMAEQKTPSPKKNICIIKQIADALKMFHDNEAIHQDLKPGNIMITEDLRAIVLDFGSVYVAGLAELHRPLVHEGALGTAAYSDPLYLMGKNPAFQGDVYSLATISYEMFTGRLPYGDDVEECQSAFDYDHLRYQAASQYNPVIPVWFDRALEKGTAFDLEERYTTINDLMRDMTQPNPEFLKDDPVTERSTNTLVFWKMLSGFWFLTFILVIYLFSQKT